MGDQAAIDGIRDLARELARVQTLINKQSGKQLSSADVIGRIKGFVETYFRVVRPQLMRLGLDLARSDSNGQRLMELAGRRSTVSLYKACLQDIKSNLNALEIATERQLSDVAGAISVVASSPTEDRVLKTLRGLLPTTAKSYEQVMLDLAIERLSYRGTATELREILRETLDHLAPNGDVEKSEGFQLERDLKKPTMAQKARFILRQRGVSKTSSDAPRKAIEIVEDTVSSFVRSTYDRGSVDTHTATGISKSQVLQLKMYVDTVLCELLEIHSKS